MDATERPIADPNAIGTSERVAAIIDPAITPDQLRKIESFSMVLGGSLLCYVAAPDGVSIELMQC